MWKILQATAIAVTISIATPAAQKPPKADDLLNAAKQKATDQHKSIFLIFGASWCEACHELDTFLDNPEVVAIFDKYFVIAKITFGEGAAGHAALDNPGSDALITKYGGLAPGEVVSLPFIAVLDPTAKLLVTSNMPGKTQPHGDNGGFPIQPEEVRWFLEMLKKGAPAITEDETGKIQEALRAAVVVAPGD
jgi:thioredoxin-related protein